MKKILIIGAGFLQNFVIRKARSMGYKTLAVDADPTAIGFQYADRHKVIDIVDEKACLAYAQEEKIDGVLTAATDYGVMTASYIAQEMGLKGLHYEAARLIKNKYRVRRCLYENHVDDTEQAYEVDEGTDLEGLAQRLVLPVMVKPCDGSGSRGASRVDELQQFFPACCAAMEASITHRAEVETFIVGQEYGAESLVVDGEVHVLGIMKKWMTLPPYYAELGHAIPSGLSADIENRARECVRKSIEALGVNSGSVNSDMVITGEGKIHIIDVGARMGGNMIGPCVIPYGTGKDYMAAMLQNAAGDPVELEDDQCGAVATRLLAFQEGVVRKLPDFAALEREYGVEIYHHLSVGQRVHEYHTNLDGCGYVIARADNVDLAVQKAERVLNIVRDEIFAESGHYEEGQRIMPGRATV